MQWKEWRRVKYKMLFYFPSSSTFFKFLERTGRRCASVLKIQCSRGSRSSSENIKYKYLERETWVCEAWGTRLVSETTKTQEKKPYQRLHSPYGEVRTRVKYSKTLRSTLANAEERKLPCASVPWTRTTQSGPKGLLWRLRSKESACRRRRHGFSPWSGKTPHSEELSPCTTTVAPGSRNYRAHVPQGLKPRCPRARVLQGERPPRWEACPLQPERSPAHHN